MADYRFRNRLPKPGEGKTLRAQLRPTRAEATSGSASTVGRIYLYDVIDSWGGYWGVSAAEFIEALDSLGDVSEVHVHLNSPGGEVYEAIAILNALRNHPARVVAVVDGIAASAASFIAVGADETIMGENTELMIHDAWGLAVGNAAAFRQFATELDRVSDNIASIYAAKSGGDAATWRAVMIDEHWYSATEAADAGLADRVGTVEDQGEAAVPQEDETPAESDDDLFDLAAMGFKYSGRAEAPEPTVPVEPGLEPGDDLAIPAASLHRFHEIARATA